MFGRWVSKRYISINEPDWDKVDDRMVGTCWYSKDLKSSRAHSSNNNGKDWIWDGDRLTKTSDDSFVDNPMPLIQTNHANSCCPIPNNLSPSETCYGPATLNSRPGSEAPGRLTPSRSVANTSEVHHPFE